MDETGQRTSTGTRPVERNRKECTDVRLQGQIRLRQHSLGLRRNAETPIDELVNAPVDALQGVSPRHAELLEEAFNIKTVGDLGTNKYFLWAQAVAKLAE